MQGVSESRTYESVGGGGDFGTGPLFLCNTRLTQNFKKAGEDDAKIQI